MKLTEAQQGWLAGLIDADGCIIFRKRKDSKMPRASVRIANNSKALMDKLQEVIPEGCVYETFYERGTTMSYQFCIERIDVIDVVLKQLVKYLIVKKEKAKVVLEFIKIRKQLKPKRTSRGTFAKTEPNPVVWALYKKFCAL